MTNAGKSRAALANLCKAAAPVALAVVCFAAPAEAPAQQAWKAGSFLFGGDGGPTTGTIALQLGVRPATYTVRGTDTDVSLEFFLPAQARTYPVEATVVESRQNVLTGEEAELRGVALTQDTIIFDFRITGQMDALAMIDVRTNQQGTTTTMTPLGTGLTMSGGGTDAPLHFQVAGQQVMRLRTPQGFRIVAPLGAGGVARLAISRQELTPEEIKGLKSVGGNAMVAPRREDEVAGLQ